jgi:hypothetical protein
MARLDQSMKHGQTPEVALANFRTAIEEAQAKYSTWIHRVDWSSDSRVATLLGPGYSIDLTCDDELVHAKGNVPLMLKLMERPIMRFVAATLEKQAAAQATGDVPPSNP